MNWDQLLSPARLGGEIRIPYLKRGSRGAEGGYEMSEFEKDYWRIVGSSAFRRLQDKTQVFPLEKNDFIRTRLTHSQEVSAIAKQLVMMIYSALSAKAKPGDAYPFTEQHAKDAAEIAACAGLLHDIGNPPFGHFGEDVILAWFKNNLGDANPAAYGRDAHLTSYLHETRDETGAVAAAEPVSLIRDALIEDLRHFEGNAQAFRLLTKLHRVDSEKGLNLTAGVLNTLVKYPTDSCNVDKRDPDICKHKLGYYEADRANFETVARATGTAFAENGAMKHHRHPLTFILEAADDIAYATADVEDSYKKNLFTLDEFRAHFKATLDDFYAKKWAAFDEAARRGEQPDIKRYELEGAQKYGEVLVQELDSLRESADSDLQAFQMWINYARHWLMYCAAFGFANHYAEIMEGRFKRELLWNTFHVGTMEALKGAMWKFTFLSTGVLKQELSAETIFENLLNRFIPAAADWGVPSGSRAAKRKVEERLMILVSENHKEAYKRHRKSADAGERAEYERCMRAWKAEYERKHPGQRFEAYLKDKCAQHGIEEYSFEYYIKEYDLYLRLMLVADFLSGMTDTYAKTMYQELSGF